MRVHKPKYMYVFTCFFPIMRLSRQRIVRALLYRMFAGRVLDGLLTVRKIENVPTGANNKPKLPIVVAQCGQL